ncbi:unnamed protein product, partial [Rotaria sp. Silwood2]
PIGHKMIWRGVVENLIDQYQEGIEGVWWAFTSCTTACKTLESAPYFNASGTRVVFSIGTESGKSIRSHSDFMGEDEILLPPGFNFKVAGKMKIAETVYIIQLEDIKSPYGLLVLPLEPASPKITPLTALENEATESGPTFRASNQIQSGNHISQPMVSMLNPDWCKRDSTSSNTIYLTSQKEVPVASKPAIVKWLDKPSSKISMPESSSEQKFPNADESFELCIGDVQIQDNGHVAIHGPSLNSGEVRGKQEYSLGKHQLRLKVEKNPSRMLPVIGIISKSAAIKPNSYKAPSSYAWASYDRFYQGGVLQKNGDMFSVYGNLENDIIELIINATDRTLQYEHERRKQAQQMT